MSFSGRIVAKPETWFQGSTDPAAHEGHSLSQIAACAGFVLVLQRKEPKSNQDAGAKIALLIGVNGVLLVPSAPNFALETQRSRRRNRECPAIAPVLIPIVVLRGFRAR